MLSPVSMRNIFFKYCFVLFRELRKVVDDGRTGGIVRPGRPELLQLAYHNSLPFVGKTGITAVADRPASLRIIGFLKQGCRASSFCFSQKYSIFLVAN